MKLLLLPYPPSVNATRPDREAYRAAVQEAWSKQGKPNFGHQKLWVRITSYPPDDRVRDIDNIVKPTLDALNGLAWTDDRQIAIVITVRGWTKKKPALLLEYRPLRGSDVHVRSQTLRGDSK